jgi:hypothetical protein
VEFHFVTLYFFRFAKQQITLDEYRAKAQVKTVSGDGALQWLASNFFDLHESLPRFRDVTPPQASVKQANARTAEVALQRHALREEVRMRANEHTVPPSGHLCTSRTRT